MAETKRNKNLINSKSFKHKRSITGSTYNVSRRIIDEDGNNADNPDYVANKRAAKKVEIAVSLKHLGNFWNSLNIPLVNFEVSLAVSWSATCVITSMKKLILVARRSNRSDFPRNAAFKITNTKLYVPVVTLSAENGKKLLEQKDLKELLHGINIDQKYLIRL